MTITEDYREYILAREALGLVREEIDEGGVRARLLRVEALLEGILDDDSEGVAP